MKTTEYFSGPTIFYCHEGYLTKDNGKLESIPNVMSTDQTVKGSTDLLYLSSFIV